MIKLEHYYDVMPNTKVGVLECMANLQNIDEDFNGNNGLEYLWEDAEGFPSNAEYCWSIAQKEPTPSAIIEKFISMWMGRDYYYQDYDIGIVIEDDKLFLSLAYITM